MFLGEKAHTLICIGCLLRDICCSGSAMRSCLFVVSVCNVIVRLVQEPCIKLYLCLRMALGQVIRMLYCTLIVTCNAVVEL